MNYALGLLLLVAVSASTPSKTPKVKDEQAYIKTQKGFGCFVPWENWLGDGECDGGIYNTPECGYDGGDCCFESCEDGAFSCGISGYECIDPAYNNVCDVAFEHWVGDGWCDGDEYNVPECGYDGGDCCESTCEGLSCGGGGYDCQDPNGNLCSVSQPSWVGDGWCDGDEYNVPECGYDGGDCCAETCVGSNCGNFAFDCKDPAYQCNVAFPSSIGDGWCDGFDYNTPECGFDGGDCCEETCVDSDHFSCGVAGYTCIDPSVVVCDVDHFHYLGDGYCDGGDYNTLACGFDGGDCCEFSCIDGDYQCGSNGYDCPI